MLYHVIVRYDWENNPTSKIDSLSKLVEYSRWMNEQSEVHKAKKIDIYWGINEPVGYGIFEAEEKESLQELIKMMPGEPEVTISAVKTLPEVIDEGIYKLKTSNY